MVFIATMTKENLVKKLFSVAERIHLRVFGHAMSDEMRKFLGYLSWSFFGGIIAAGVMFVVNIFAARWLGPEEFGKYNSILSIASALVFFILLGGDIGVVRFAADKKEKTKDHASFLTIAAGISFFSSLLLLVIFFFFRLSSGVFSGEYTELAIYFAIALAAGNLFDAFLRTKGLFFTQSILKIGNALIAGAFFVFAFLIFHKKSADFYVYALASGYVFFVLSSFFFLRKNFGEFSWKNFRKLIGYQKFLVVSGISGMLMGLEKYLVGRFIGISELGIYSVYHAASFLIIANLGSIFMNAFMPVAVRNHESMAVVLEKLKNLFFKVFFFWVLLDSSVLYFSLKLVGNSYPFYPLYAVSFSIISFLAFSFSTLVSVMNIKSVNVGTFFSVLMNTSILFSIVSSRSLERYIFLQIVIYGGLVMAAFFFFKQRENIL